ncbi:MULTISPECIES: CcdC family protein [Ureibacillus]|jgi:membrane protein CcdC involved in cytochrome C biogenesis|uniref:Membrane protein CcdC involved in cytochrome C biogenesis n=1 Tax=Ureibacillus thermosphaericus TaxID=51173 RepID=A0A840PV26_URETH|nr:cytochrome c biogenesis protein CcdC [Ureibacillus thermosphaericus]MBB5148582.1 membrane protein CcdC involved in cytochrome C biogenesis [Ureibacillus thermosphaericus]NKZ31300.1 cytochrome c biogenesis protein CcdC [Ureibacillus thermosphaericus]
MFEAIPSRYIIIASTLMAIFMGTFIMMMRLRSQKKPVNAKKILIPPIAMSTGALMFIFEEFRVPPLQILEAVIVGIIFSIVLITTSKFEIRNNEIYMKRSKAFFIILVSLLLIRIAGKIVLTDSFDPGELAGMFWILAFAMLWPWRIAMFIQYKKIEKSNLVN